MRSSDELVLLLTPGTSFLASRAIFRWDNDPANTMVRRLIALSPMTEAIRVMSCGKKPFI